MIELAERITINDSQPTAWWEPPSRFFPDCEVQHCHRPGEYMTYIYPCIKPWEAAASLGPSDIIQYHTVRICEKHKLAMERGLCDSLSIERSL